MTSGRAISPLRWPAWLAAIATALGAPGVAAASASPLPGVYESLIVAVAPDGALTGYFREQLGSEPARECAFFVSGRGEQVVAWSAGDAHAIRGSLKAEGSTLTLVLPEVRGLPGCGSVLSPDAGEGLRLERTDLGDWRGLAVVAAPRAPLYASAAATRSTAHVVAGDVLAVSSSSGRRLLVTYVNDEGRAFRMWISTALTRVVRSPPPS